MANVRLTVQHKNGIYEPPVEDGVKIEWETNAPGKLTFTTINTHNTDTVLTEGDIVRFYCDDKPVFLGYVFSKKRDRDQNVEVTCYDQIRYMKNKFTYVFEKKHAHTILQLLCDDLGLKRAAFAHTMYPIPYLAEENKSVLDIVNDALEETLLNIGEKFVMYDDFGKIQLKNSTDMKSTTLIVENTAENFDYKSSIDSDTYNQVVLYYKGNDDSPNVSIYTATGTTRVKDWGLLRYFEETDTPTAAQQKANALLKLYNRKTRELSFTGAFGDITVRGGTLIPVELDLGDVNVSNYMLVDKVTHNFNQGSHTMDLTVSADFGDDVGDVDSQVIETEKYVLTINIREGYFKGAPLIENPRGKAAEILANADTQHHGTLYLTYIKNYATETIYISSGGTYTVQCDADSPVSIRLYTSNESIQAAMIGINRELPEGDLADWTNNGDTWNTRITKDNTIGIKW